jgi:hypothetical protein
MKKKSIIIFVCVILALAALIFFMIKGNSPVPIGIQYTPTWVIGNKEYVGVQSVDTIKNLTGCNQASLENASKCIGNNSVLYVQLGCSHCEDQKALFGDSYKYLTIIDCFYTPEKCQNVTATPA